MFRQGLMKFWQDLTDAMLESEMTTIYTPADIRRKELWLKIKTELRNYP